MYRILLVDDAASVREALRWMLENEDDFAIIGEASDGLEALERAGQLRPDAIILDLEMPHKDGLQVAAALKSAANPPQIIFLSVHDDPATRQRCAAVGGDGFAAKNAGWSALITQLRRVLPKRGQGGASGASAYFLRV